MSIFVGNEELPLRYADIGCQVIGAANFHREPKGLAEGKTYIKHIPNISGKAAILKILSGNNRFSKSE